jgi:hypothetical protein
MKKRLIPPIKSFAIPAMALVLALILSFFGGCFFEEGGGSDQPNRLQGKVTTGEGVPIASAHVRLYSGKYQPGPDIGLAPALASLVKEVRTSSTGAFALPTEGGDHFLELHNADSTAVWVENALTDLKSAANLGNLNLADAASLKGLVVSSQSVTSMLIAGTHFQTSPDASGKFTFPMLPPGRYRLVARMGPESGNQLVPVEVVNLEAGQSLDLDSLFVEPNQILMFNFDTVENFSRLRGLTFPYSQTDAALLGGWWPRPQELVSAGAFRKKSLHAKLKEKQHIGFSMGLGYQDLSKMTAMSFWAKGTGNIQVMFHSQLVNYGDPTFQYQLTLNDTTTWHEYRILASDIVSNAPDSLNYIWSRGSSEVGKITFYAHRGPVEIWLDEIRLEGLTYRDLGPIISAGKDALPNK